MNIRQSRDYWQKEAMRRQEHIDKRIAELKKELADADHACKVWMDMHDKLYKEIQGCSECTARRKKEYGEWLEAGGIGIAKGWSGEIMKQRHVIVCTHTDPGYPQVTKITVDGEDIK